MPPLGSTADRLRALERDGRDLRRALKNLQSRDALAPALRNPRLARTSSIGTYPFRVDAANTWEIVFTDETFDEEFPGAIALATTYRQSEPKFVAHNTTNAPYVPFDTLIEVWRDNNRWWFTYYDWDLLTCELQGNLSAGGSVTVKWIAAKGGDNSNITAHDDLGTFEGNSGDRAYVRWNHFRAKYLIENVQC